MSKTDNLPDIVRKLRRSKNMTQEELAGEASISVNVIRRLETSASGVSVETLVKIAKALNTSTDELLGLSESQKDPLEKFKEMADKFYGKPKPTTIGELGKEDLKVIIKETMAELAKNSQTSDQTISSLGKMSEDEIKIIELLRNDPSFTSTVIKLLTPDEDLAPVAPPIPMANQTVVAPKGRVRKAK